MEWLKKNLFNTWYNTLLTIVSVVLVVWIAQGLLNWVFRLANWSVVLENVRLFLVGRYPTQQLWRLWLVLGLVLLQPLLLLLQAWVPKGKLRQILQWVSWALLPLALLLTFWLLGGGFGLRTVRSSFWGGLTLTLLVALVSVVLAFPFSIFLALGRQSKLPIVRWVCTAYIEIVRGLPLIGILFMAQVMLPLVLPSAWRLDRLLRAIAGLVLFNAAYLAENVRGGLQSIPPGQVDASQALGLNTVQTLRLIVLPQALRLVLPAIVGQFISMFKDTSLLALFSLFELTGIARSILSQPDFLGRNAEVFLFIGLVYWVFCYGMSLVSRRLEQQN
ncbi:amino acid ABC transporter permease [filamentous cyanobacterium LEGE 11480]|uniref:Amino acid ABC transporter permease n=2 Tax=Romeriopsis TaxID=2992131 RepID=A0A928VKJ6_9CYAN|nr:amino acid ABC transporter permease [Romeriopsis navalis LEGE 11480]